jgi:hypothetical protein
MRGLRIFDFGLIPRINPGAYTIKKFLVITPPGKRVSEEEKFDAKIQDKDDRNGDVDRF